MFEAISRGPEEDGGKPNLYSPLMDKTAVVDLFEISKYSHKLYAPSGLEIISKYFQSSPPKGGCLVGCDWDTEIPTKKSSINLKLDLNEHKTKIRNIIPRLHKTRIHLNTC